ncbi:hypothetical protein ACFK5S_004383 [Salmonella enterica subsp. enterica serovar Saintpaul]|nr:hypothetical protein [Salmonella enterica]EBX0087337.1 hypothetical protein [Salmonella enterica subsp. enterica serovar Miami]ECC8720516.1 hypothetical protein [Salmonella enterica subsp. houtenae]ECT9565153.1 hypothetical protein [Salmonella enterica subsp. enterica serovar Newport]EDQ6994677.1 hypothetical protein [Salmonella enterica subsp. enterica serovar Saintpaul]
MSYGSLVESKNFDIVFSNCKDKKLQMGVQTSNLMMYPSWAYFDSGDPDHRFYYNIQHPEDSEILGGGNNLGHKFFSFFNDNPLIIQPGSDNYTMSSKVNFYKKGNPSLANVGSVVSASFTYNITYQ